MGLSLKRAFVILVLVNVALIILWETSWSLSPSAVQDDMMVGGFSSPNSSRKTTPQQRTLSMLVEFGGGELGNMMGFLTSAYISKLLIEDHLENVKVKLIVQQSVASLGLPGHRRSESQMLRCFPSTRDIDYDGGWWDPRFFFKKRQQQSWLKENEIELVNVHNESQLAYLGSLLEAQARGDPSVPRPEAPGSKYSIPYVTIKKMLSIEVLEKYAKYYPKLYSWFSINATDTDCCLAIPEPDETVFHYRNFLTEHKYDGLPIYGKEVTAAAAEKRFFSESKPGDSVVLISRYYDKHLWPFVSMLEKRGVKVRVQKGQSGIQDLCFLMKAQKEVIGSSGSTYLRWGGVLGEAKTVKMYRVSNPRWIWAGEILDGNLTHGDRTFYFENYKNIDGDYESGGPLPRVYAPEPWG